MVLADAEGGTVYSPREMGREFPGPRPGELGPCMELLGPGEERLHQVKGLLQVFPHSHWESEITIPDGLLLPVLLPDHPPQTSPQPPGLLLALRHTTRARYPGPSPGWSLCQAPWPAG